MDESSWEFFSNNSPKLVKIKSKSPLFDKNRKKDQTKVVLSSLTRLKLKDDYLHKNSFRTIYRNNTPKPNVTKFSNKASKPGLIPSLTTLSPLKLSKKLQLLNQKNPNFIIKKLII